MVVISPEHMYTSTWYVSIKLTLGLMGCAMSSIRYTPTQYTVNTYIIYKYMYANA